MPKDEQVVDRLPKDEPNVNEQEIPEEVLKQLPPEVKAQLGYTEKQDAVFKMGNSAGLGESIDRLREGFEKIGLTLIGRMGEFASTLERVVMTVARIEKVENLSAETTYFLKNLQKTLDEFKRDFSKIVDKVDTVELFVERLGGEIADIKQRVSSAPATPPYSPQQPSPTPQLTSPVQAPPTSSPSSTSPSDSTSPSRITPITANLVQEVSSGSSRTPLLDIIATIHTKVRTGMNTRLIADVLDQAREKISELCKWTPAVYELGKIARNLRKTEALLTDEEFNKITELLEQCKNSTK